MKCYKIKGIKKLNISFSLSLLGRRGRKEGCSKLERREGKKKKKKTSFD
jgi:hypothetical protein